MPVALLLWQATVALVTPNELNVLLGAMGTVWGTLVLIAGVLWRIGTAWVKKVETRIEALQTELAKVPLWIQLAIDAHNALDEKRHTQQMDAIQANADALTVPLTQIQIDAAVLRERVGAIEDTPHEHQHERKGERRKR